MTPLEKIIFFSDRYEFTREGRVFCLPKMQGWCPRPRKEKKVAIDKHGYLMHTMKMDGKNLNLKVHQIVWVLHYGDIPEALQINHKDGVKTNNCIDNLELVTSAENSKHARDTGLYNPRAKRKQYVWKNGPSTHCKRKKIR